MNVQVLITTARITTSVSTHQAPIHAVVSQVTNQTVMIRHAKVRINRCESLTNAYIRD